MAEISVLNPLDTCRLCKKYLKNGPNGILTNTNAIFKKRPGSITIAARLERIGIYVTPCLDKSMRLCRSCYRKMAHVESAFETLRLWKAAMGVPTSDVTFEPNTNINSATLKRQREPSPGRGGDGKKPRLSKILARKSTVEVCNPKRDFRDSVMIFGCEISNHYLQSNFWDNRESYATTFYLCHYLISVLCCKSADASL